MAKQLRNDQIGADDLIEFLDGSSDFGFELRCVEALSKLGFSCEHGGSYVDPVTKKARQFDIRARNEDEADVRIRCAVECKNLTKNFPLLIMCVPRAQGESFHELVFSFLPRPIFGEVPAFQKYCKIIRFSHPMSNYVFGSPVGKSSVQVGKARDNSFETSDAEVFDKWSQALASAHDLAYGAAVEGKERTRKVLSLVLPMVVVPDGTLWQAEYSDDGTRTRDPVAVDRCSFFVGRDYEAGDRLGGSMLTVSHLEFVTLSGLTDLAASLLNHGNRWFPPHPFTTD